MAKITPFKAVRPKRSVANLLASRPFYTYKKHLLEAKLEGNPFTFLHVINPEFNKEDKTLPNSIERFQKVRNKYKDFHKLGYFVRDQKDYIYLYRQTTSFGTFVGIICGAAVEDVKNGIIKPHEKTLSKREETFKLYLDTCKFHAEPVLLTYKENNTIQSVKQSYLRKRPEYEFTTTDKKSHELWVINDSEDITTLTSEFSKLKDIYVADGHHRIASSKLYSNATSKNDPLAHFFLSFFINEQALKIFAYHRFIKTIGKNTEAQLLEKINKHFKVVKHPKKFIPSKKHSIGLYLNKNWFELSVKASSINEDHPTSSLDTQILSEFILDPILGIKDLKTDDRVDFFNGARDIKELINMVDNSKNGAAFILYPHIFSEVKKVADSKNSMPPKSTWIEPKIRSGLTIYEL